MKDYMWLIAVALAAIVLLSPVACTMHRQRLIAEAIKGGADPIAAKCAIESETGDTRSSTVCIIKAIGISK